MAIKERKIVHVPAGGELAALLDEAGGQPLTLERNGTRYRLTREETGEDIWAGYDPEAARRVIREMAGSISEEEADRLTEMIYRAREEGTRPADRP